MSKLWIVKIHQFSTFMDIMMRLLFAMQIHTLCIGAAADHCSWKKGKCYMFPHAKGSNVLTYVPVFFPTGNTHVCSSFPADSGSYYVSYDSATAYSFLWDDASIVQRRYQPWFFELLIFWVLFHILMYANQVCIHTFWVMYVHFLICERWIHIFQSWLTIYLHINIRFL